MERLEPTSEQINSERDTKQFKWSSGGGNVVTGTVTSSFDSLDFSKPNKLHDNKSRRGLPIPQSYQGYWHDQPDHNTEGHYYPKRHRHNFNVYTISTLVLSLLSPTVALAENVGGVSATCLNPIANSSRQCYQSAYTSFTVIVYNQYLRWWRAMSRIYIELHTLCSVCRF